LSSWTEFSDKAIRYYSGTALYETEFDLEHPRPLRWMLSPGRFENTISISVNGEDVGVIWAPWGVLDVTEALRPGTNRIAIAVANTWRNRLVGDKNLPPGERHTWIAQNKIGPAPYKGLPEDAALTPAGLFGPVRIVPIARQRIF
jgi:hypothetical protein